MKHKRWVASEDYDELVAEVAMLRKQQHEMHEMFHEMIIAGNSMYYLAVADSTGLWTSEQYQSWKKLVDTFE
jgi:hypothetical protein